LLLGYKPRFINEIYTVDESLRMMVLEDVLANNGNDEAIIASNKYETRLSKLDELRITAANRRVKARLKQVYNNPII